MAAEGESPSNIMVRVLKADGVRMHNDKKPHVLGQLRINVGGHGDPPFRTSAIEGTSGEWNQQFVLPVTAPASSQLECTLWDDSDSGAADNANFLGEVSPCCVSPVVDFEMFRCFLQNLQGWVAIRSDGF